MWSKVTGVLLVLVGVAVIHFGRSGLLEMWQSLGLGAVGGVVLYSGVNLLFGDSDDK